MAGVRIRALTERHPIKPTSPRCHSAWQLNLGRHSTYRRGKSVQTTGTTSGRYRPALTPIGSVARQFLHHFSTASYVTIQGHARGICFRVNGHIAGARSGRSQPTKEDTSTKADDSNKNNDSPFME